MQRYFVKKVEKGKFILSDQDIYHIKKVMRFNENDKIEVVANEIVYLCNIDSLEPFGISIIKQYQEDRNLNINLTIGISLVQEQKFDLIIQKLTELGVTDIIPLKTERSKVKIEEKKIEKKYQRWNMICKEASEQSNRTSVPIIEPITSLAKINTTKFDLKLICSTSNKSKSIKEIINKQNNDAKNILFIIGPEGGFSENEENKLINNEFIPISLGKRILRVETAAIYVASIINYIYG